jgi:hypothetical protein
MEQAEIIRQAERMQRVASERLQAIPALDACIAHVTMCDELGCRPGDYRIGTPRETIEASVRRFKKRAGVRGLIRKYGKDAATTIIENKTGRHYNLR